MSSLCPRHSKVKHFETRKEVHPLYCRSWACETCQPKRRSQLIARHCSGKPTAMVTITWAAGQDKTVEEAETEQRKAWAAFCRYWQRRHPGRKLSYSLAREYTQNGWPHLHVLIRDTWIDRHDLREFMRDRIGSPIVDVRKIDSHRKAASYVAKYVGKTYERRGTGKRYWCTRDWDLTRIKQPDGSYKSQAEEAGWLERPLLVTIWLNYTPHAVADYWSTIGYTPRQARPNVWTTAPPEPAQQQQEAA